MEMLVRLLGNRFGSVAVIHFDLLVTSSLIERSFVCQECHARDTYAAFVKKNKDILETMPPPDIAVEYYRGDDLYIFDDFQVRELVIDVMGLRNDNMVLSGRSYSWLSSTAL